MTFSLAGRCEKTGMMGGFVCSSSIAVASRCLWGSPHGIVLSQNVTDPLLGVLGTQLLAQGFGAASVLRQIVDARAHAQWRQLLVIDRNGDSAHHTGTRGLGTTAVAQGRHCIAAGNMLANAEVPRAAAQAFDDLAQLPLAERLLAGLEAAQKAGGEAGAVHSAGLCVYGREVWPLAELRVDWSEQPIADLRRLWALYAPQMQDYHTRALNPDLAPSYGVPGDP